MAIGEPTTADAVFHLSASKKETVLGIDVSLGRPPENKRAGDLTGTHGKNVRALSLGRTLAPSE